MTWTGHRAFLASANLRKLLTSVGVLGIGASVAGLGTYGSFTSVTSVDDTLAAGTLAVRLGEAGTAGNRLTVAFTGGVPGDSIQRVATLTNAGNQNFGAVTLTTTAVTPNAQTAPTKLVTDGTLGLQVTVDACSVPWTEAGTAPAYTYTCSGTTTPVLATRPILGTDLALSNLGLIVSTKADNLRVTATLPTAADNTFQNLAGTVNFAFTATQRAATSR
ncbi:hypothetical protein GM708_00790 [Vibrio cholerae]|nr:hypothetical protein [Vibrio cholerae]